MTVQVVFGQYGCDQPDMAVPARAVLIHCEHHVKRPALIPSVHLRIAKHDAVGRLGTIADDDAAVGIQILNQRQQQRAQRPYPATTTHDQDFAAVEVLDGIGPPHRPAHTDFLSGLHLVQPVGNPAGTHDGDFHVIGDPRG